MQIFMFNIYMENKEEGTAHLCVHYIPWIKEKGDGKRRKSVSDSLGKY